MATAKKPRSHTGKITPEIESTEKESTEKFIGVYAKLTPAEKRIIDSMGGTTYALRQFIKSSISGKEAIRGQMAILEAEKEKMQSRIVQIDLEIGHNQKMLEQLIIGESETELDNSQSKNTRDWKIFKSRTGIKSQKIESPSAWERRVKLNHLILAADNKLNKADEINIRRIMRLDPNMPLNAWLYSMTPETIDPKVIDAAVWNKNPAFTTLYTLLQEDKIGLKFYEILMMWLGLPTKDSVNDWILARTNKLKECDLNNTVEQKRGSHGI